MARFVSVTLPKKKREGHNLGKGLKCLSVLLDVSLSICLSFFLSVCLFICMSDCLSLFCPIALREEGREP